MLSEIKIKTPLRVSWDISDLSEINSEIIDLFPKVKAKFLFEFNLIVTQALLQNGSADFWKTHYKSLPETTLTIIKSPDPRVAELVNRYPFHLVIVDWSEGKKAAVDFYKAVAGNKAVRFVLKEDNLDRVAELLELCRDLKVVTLVFANPSMRETKQNKRHLIDPRVLQASADKFSSQLKGLEKTCKIQVHDLFFEEILFGKGRREGNFAGCQAGLYLAHVDSHGTVYGCASLPIEIGQLKESCWEEIWQSEKRAALRSQIESESCVCRKCEVFNSCKGGCRGLSWIKYGNFDKPDILCQTNEL